MYYIARCNNCRRKKKKNVPSPEERNITEKKKNVEMFIILLRYEKYMHVNTWRAQQERVKIDDIYHRWNVADIENVKLHSA